MTTSALFLFALSALLAALVLGIVGRAVRRMGRRGSVFVWWG